LWKSRKIQLLRFSDYYINLPLWGYSFLISLYWDSYVINCLSLAYPSTHRYRKAKIDCLSFVMCLLLAQPIIALFSSFFAAAVYSTNEANKAGGTRHWAVYILRCLCIYIIEINIHKMLIASQFTFWLLNQWHYNQVQKLLLHRYLLHFSLGLCGLILFSKF